jgi:hypothetical protein
MANKKTTAGGNLIPDTYRIRGWTKLKPESSKESVSQY